MTPDEITDQTEFAAELNRMLKATGLSYKDVVERAAWNGNPLSMSSISAIVNGGTIPWPHYLRAFLQAIGVDSANQIDAWIRARDRVWELRRESARPAEIQRIDQELAALRDAVMRIDKKLTEMRQRELRGRQ